ncbi:MAG TPA: UvrD-helicase domain-containing protein [Allosphingosinicella sp.]
MLKRVAIGDNVYILEKELVDDEVPLVIINLDGEGAIFGADQPNSNIFDRVITVSKAVYTRNVIVPTGWKPHREDSWLSINAAPWNRDRSSRIHFECGLGDQKDLFVFARTQDTIDFADVDQPTSVYTSARSDFAAAILTPQADAPDFSRAGIILSQRLPQGFVQGATLDQWYESKLTEEQRSFVQKPHDGPVRLRGAAGTGKTLSLVIKFLRDGLALERGPEESRLGFLTHSLASQDLVSSILESLDPVVLVHGMGKRCQLEVRTIYDLAHEHLRFSLDNLEPLSLDGREGRRMQLEIITQVLAELWRSAIIRAQFKDLSPGVGDRWAAAAAGLDLRFGTEIMNEFASVLDAEGIRAGEERGENYVRSSVGRPEWLMSLPAEIDRRFVLEVHKRYRKTLGEMNTLSVDQMVGDFDSFLNSNRWDRVRNRLGYDALFVDELHLFTSVERQLLHKLIKTRMDENEKPRRPPIFMAYDLKQSPWDTFTEYSEGTSASSFYFQKRIAEFRPSAVNTCFPVHAANSRVFSRSRCIVPRDRHTR